jgi:hypothetical protein
MQPYLQCRRIYKQLQKQIVTKHKGSEYIQTHERRYWYLPGGGLSSESGDPLEESTAQRWQEHGHRAWLRGPTLEIYTARSHV